MLRRTDCHVERLTVRAQAYRSDQQADQTFRDEKKICLIVFRF